MYSKRMKTTDEFLAEAKYVSTGSPSEEFKGLLKGLVTTKKAFQAGNPNKGYRSAVMSMWDVARVLTSMGVGLPDGIAWEALQMTAKSTERNVKRDSSDEAEWTDGAIRDAKFALKLSRNGTKVNKRVLSVFVDTLHGLAGTMYGQEELQKDAERVVDRVARSLRSAAAQKKM